MGSRGRVIPNQKGPWVKTISKGPEFRVVQPKVDRTKNKNPLPYGRGDKRFDDGEDAALRVIGLLSEGGGQFQVSEFHSLLGGIYESKGETEKAIHHYELPLGIASAFGWYDALFWNHYSLAVLFWNEDRFDDAQIHIEHAESHTVDGAYPVGLGRATQLRAMLWYRQHRLEEAKSEALRTADHFQEA
jgi:tetratricopeptide (TPR) repeat protein